MTEQDKALASMLAARMAQLATQAPDGADIWKRSFDVGAVWGLFARALGYDDERSKRIIRVADRYAALLYQRWRRDDMAR